MIGKWLKRKAYVSKTIGIVQAVTFMIGPDGKLLHRHKGVIAAILANHGDGMSEPVAALHVSAVLIANSIEAEDDTIRKQIIEQLLIDWSRTENPRSIRRGLREGTLIQDALLTRLQWALLMAQDMLADGEIAAEDFAILKDEIYGSLRGEDRGERTVRRLSIAVEDAFGTALSP